MREPCGEGLASHADPESCVVSREAGHEVLTGAHADGVLSREIPGNQPFLWMARLRPIEGELRDRFPGL